MILLEFQVTRISIMLSTAEKCASGLLKRTKKAGGMGARKERLVEVSVLLFLGMQYAAKGTLRDISRLWRLCLQGLLGMVGTLTELNSSLHLLKADLAKENFGWPELSSLNLNASTQLLSLFTQ
jgi:hypothetical protein